MTTTSDAETQSPLPVLKPGDGSYVEHATGRVALPVPPVLLLGTVTPAILRMYFAPQLLTSVGCYELSGISVTSHGILLRDGRPLQSAQLNLDPASVASTRTYGELLLDVPPTRTIAGTVVNLIGPGASVYGHWLVDFLPKLYLLHRSGLVIRNLRYLLPENTPNFGLEWLKLLGISQEQIVWYSPFSEVVLPERLLVPTLLRTNSAAHPILADAADFVASMAPRTPRRRLPTRLFLSRAAANANWREMTNRDEIEIIAQRAGCHVLAPEQLSLLEQLQLFRSAQWILGEYGSALHGSLFCGNKTVVCCLRAAAVHPGFLQSGLCAVRRQRVAYVFAAANESDVAQKFSVAPADFACALNALAAM